MPDNSDGIIARLISLSDGGKVPVRLSEFGDKVCLMPSTSGPLAEIAFPESAEIKTVWYNFLTSDGFWSFAVWNSRENVVYVYPISDHDLHWYRSKDKPISELIACPDYAKISVDGESYTISD
jgi:hypothetical protein